jgi:uncharacterized protein
MRARLSDCAAMSMLIALLLSLNCRGAESAGDAVADPSKVDFRWGVKIPLRDGVKLNATVYTPRNQSAPAPCIFTLTPYIAQSYHDRGVYFAAHGLPFLTVDVRGRGNSEGEFHPFIQEARDGYDVVEWLAQQPYCNGKVGMWGGSYAGYDQWAAAKEFPPHLGTIVPAAAPYAGVDFPMFRNMFAPYDMTWLTYTAGHTSQDRMFADDAFWSDRYRRWFEAGEPFKNFDAIMGNPSAVFQEWVAHPHPDALWDTYNPTAEQYGKLEIPILTITGSHDDDQPGALTHYREHMKHASAGARARHYLVIGPWDHAGTRTPSAQFGGVTFGPVSLVDLPKLHLDWYAWTLQGGAKPGFLKAPVAYYVINADTWKYAQSLQTVTGETRILKLGSTGRANDVFASGSLTDAASAGKPDRYVYDPRDVGIAALEASIDPSNLADQRMLYARHGKLLVYHSAPFEKDTEISGFFTLSAWIAIDQPDTDFEVDVYEIRPDGTSLKMTGDAMRARYRESSRSPKLVGTKAALRYDFNHFTFVSQLLRAGSRLRLVVAPVNSIYSEKNYNSDGEVASESIKDARPVAVSLYHDAAHPSALSIPIGAP